MLPPPAGEGWGGGSAAGHPLRDEVSTDEIIPLPAMVHFDAALGRYPLTGFTAAGERPIGVEAIRAAGIEVIVAGARYGKGRSREHAVVAERSAGGDRACGRAACWPMDRRS